MDSLQEAVGSAFGDGQDAQPHIDAIFRAVNVCRDDRDAAHAQQLLETLHCRLLPHTGGGGQPQAAEPASQGDNNEATLDAIVTEVLEPLAGLANLSAECEHLATPLLVCFASSSPREAGIMLLACLGRHVG